MLLRQPLLAMMLRQTKANIEWRRLLTALNASDAQLVTMAANTTAKLVWDVFEALYKAKSTARRQQLRRSLVSSKHKTDDTLNCLLQQSVWLSG
jgi:gag-polypeptide of LTR copia-type